ncbi:MAG TPA: FCD domain-containing protein, partial [Lachnospiraceae bacterium]|nr:FCD domain-containing protein [Lachnospiraceae bacterium]
GIYITRPDAGNLSNIISCMVAMDHIGYIDIYDVRIILEESAAEIAATCVTDDEIDRMETLLQHLDNTMLSVKERREADFQFHIEIAKATKNMLLVILIQTMKNIFIDMIETGIFLQGGIADAAARHRKILDALKAHDPVLARQSMHEHLLVSRENTKKVYLDREKAKLLNKKHDGKTEEANC